MISIRNLKKQFGDHLIFDHVNLEVKKGDAVVIIGPSGCGKSTLLRCINRLETPTAGQILVDGEDILARGAQLDKLRARMGMVYQSFNLFSNMNVLENIIAAPMKVNRQSKREAIDEAMHWLKVVGMENRRFHMPSQLSGGQKQRVAIARCLAMRPEIILFDEPTSALDPTMVDEVLSVIQKLLRQNMTSVIVTHEMQFARDVASRVVYMDEKSIYEEGTAEQIFLHPLRERTRMFIERLKVFERQITKNDLDLYSFLSDITAYCAQFGFTQRQLNAMTLVYEELIMPLLLDGATQRIAFRLRCGHHSDIKDIDVELEGLTGDPLAQPAVDEMGATMIRGLTKAQTHRQEGNNAVLHLTLQ